MTWIGRDCDIPVILDHHPNNGSEFMTWIGRDCDTLWQDDRMRLSSFIRIYDLNWKGLWPSIGQASSHVASSIRIYDLNWKGLWRKRQCPQGTKESSIRIYDLNWKGLWRRGFFVRGSEKFWYQNLWPELEGIVTFNLNMITPPFVIQIRIYDLNWKGLWLSTTY